MNKWTEFECLCFSSISDIEGSQVTEFCFGELRICKVFWRWVSVFARNFQVVRWILGKTAKKKESCIWKCWGDQFVEWRLKLTEICQNLTWKSRIWTTRSIMEQYFFLIAKFVYWLSRKNSSSGRNHSTFKDRKEREGDRLRRILLPGKWIFNIY